MAWTWLAGAAAAQTPLFEVEKSDATKVLQVNDDAGFVVQGALNAGTIPATGAGVRFMWYPKKAAVRAGFVEGDQWDDANVGPASVAFGLRSIASGSQSTAMGADTRAGGDFATAMGGSTTASGLASTAMGGGTKATGTQSTAMGERTVADGAKATAMGSATTASGNSAVAMGNSTQALGGNSLALGFKAAAAGENSAAMGLTAVANGAASIALGDHTIAAGTASVALGTGVTAQGAGSFAFGDRSTGFPVVGGENTFSVRAFGGIALNTGVFIGCDLPPGVGTWACTSSRLAKEGFEDVDGEDVLVKLAAIPIQRWRYLNTRAAHVGPTAEDFHAAFGLGGSSTKIATVDADGVALLAVQALERRTATLQSENADLRRRLEALELTIKQP